MSTSPLLSAASLHARLSDPKVKVFDCRGTWKSPARSLPDAYAASHIDGAMFLDWTQLFLEPNVPVGLASLGDRAQAEAAFTALGITAEDTVVLYDADHHMFAGRLWWSMRSWGFENVFVLDGGFVQWEALGLPVSSTPTLPTPAQAFVPSPVEGLRVSLETMVEGQHGCHLIDARGPIGFAGTVGDPQTGHIPGALNIQFRTLLDEETSCFLPPAALESVFDAALPSWRTEPLISSCGAGYAGTVVQLALATLGVKVPLFDGSFAAWKADPARPTEQGA